jgi:hypothetical protein
VASLQKEHLYLFSHIQLSTAQPYSMGYLRWIGEPEIINNNIDTRARIFQTR